MPVESKSEDLMFESKNGIKCSSSSKQVQGTNDSSSVSKLSQSDCGYYVDCFMQHFVKKKSKRSALINRCYYARCSAMSYSLKYLLNGINGKKQIISLGSGFDTTYFQLCECNLVDDNVLYVEIDFFDVLKRKILLANEANLFSNNNSIKDNENIMFKSDSYVALCFDLRKINVGNKFYETLKKVGIDFSKPTIIISEVVLAYLTERNSSNVIQYMSKAFDNAILLIFEQINPGDSFGKVMINHFSEIGSPLQTIQKQPTLQHHCQRHKLFGYSSYSIMDLNKYYYNFLDEKERRRIEELEMFDEYESWHRACLHYFIMCSTNSKIPTIQHLCKNILCCREEIINIKYEEICVPDTLENSYIKRENLITCYGHCSCKFNFGNEKLVAIYGGFGLPLQNKKIGHRRLSNELSVINLETLAVNSAAKLNSGSNCKPCVMWSTILCRKNHLLLFGGRSSPTMCTNIVSQIEFKKQELNWSFSQSEIYVTTDKPLSRYRHTAVMVGEDMIISGGKDKETVFDDIWCFNIKNEWENISVTKERFKARHSHSCCTWNNQNSKTTYLIFSGGLNSLSEVHNDIIICKTYEHKNTVSLEIESFADMPCPRFSHSSEVLDNKLYLIGGVTIDVYLKDSITVFDLQGFNWIRNIELKFGLELSSTLLLHGHTSEFLKRKNKNTEILIFGGGDNCFSFGTWLNQTPRILSI